MKFIFIVLILQIFFVITCTEKSDEKGKQLIALAALAQSSQSRTATASTSCTSEFTCAVMPSFSTLATAGTTTSCATSGCHSNTAQQSGLDITDYNSTKAFTNPGNPCSSRMYTAIKTGAMAGNSNAKINEAVFCWILGGSNK